MRNSVKILLTGCAVGGMFTPMLALADSNFRLGARVDTYDYNYSYRYNEDSYSEHSYRMGEPPHHPPKAHSGYKYGTHARYRDQADRNDEQADRYDEQSARYEEMSCRYDEFFLGGYSCHPRYYGMSWGGPYRYRRSAPYGGVYRNFP